jgi:hypothetical protein
MTIPKQDLQSMQIKSVELMHRKMASTSPQSNPIKPTTTTDTSMQSLVTSGNGNGTLMVMAIPKQELQSIQIRAFELMHPIPIQSHETNRHNRYIHVTTRSKQQWQWHPNLALIAVAISKQELEQLN